MGMHTGRENLRIIFFAECKGVISIDKEIIKACIVRYYDNDSLTIPVMLFCIWGRHLCYSAARTAERRSGIWQRVLCKKAEFSLSPKDVSNPAAQGKTAQIREIDRPLSARLKHYPMGMVIHYQRWQGQFSVLAMQSG